MKIKIMIALLLGSFFSISAQIIITHNDLYFPLTPDTAKGNNAVNLGLIAPAIGANQTWNYSTLQLSNSANFVLDLPDTNANFSSATGKNERSDYLGPLLMTGFSDYYTNDSTGIYYLGTQIEPTSYNISGLTGGSGDELATLNSFVNFGKTQAKYRFPITAISSWTNAYSTILDFTVSINSIGLMGDTAQLKRDFTEEYSVVGWGEVNLPINLGTEEALLLKIETEQIDSLFIDGAPADPFLLAGVGLIQGMVTKTGSYEILIRGLNRSALTFEMDTSFTSVSHIHFCSKASTFEVAENLKVDANVYPNPTSGLVRVRFTKPNSAHWHLLVTDIIGREVWNREITREGNLELEMQLPQKAGSYFYVLKDELNRPRSSGKIIVD